MAKKEPTPAQLEARRKFGEAAKARAAARQAAKVEKGPELQAGEEAPTTISQDDYIDLLKQMNELKSMLIGNVPQKATVGFSNGSMVGTLEKYDVTSGNYPDPRDRLFKEARLAPFAPTINYELNWNVGISEYTTIDNVRMKEPKFTLELVRKIMDEETGELTDGRYIVCRLIMHEDPEAALVIARDNGIEVEATDEATFLNEMRYLRMRDWLIECFYPAPIKKDHKKKDMVIGGKIVEYYEVTSETPEKINYGALKDHKL